MPETTNPHHRRATDMKADGLFKGFLEKEAIPVDELLIEHMDFRYVATCTHEAELEKMIDVLR